jgi:hypothetical protein
MIRVDARLAGTIDEAGAVLTYEAGYPEPHAHGIGQQTVLETKRHPLDTEYTSRLVCLPATYARFSKFGWFALCQINQENTQSLIG